MRRVTSGAAIPARGRGLEAYVSIHVYGPVVRPPSTCASVCNSYSNPPFGGSPASKAFQFRQASGPDAGLVTTAMLRDAAWLRTFDGPTTWAWLASRGLRHERPIAASIRR